MRSAKRWLGSCAGVLGCVALLGVSACQAPGDDPASTASKRDPLQASSLHPAVAPRLELVEQGPTGLLAKLDAGRFEVGLRTTYGRQFSTLGCPGCGTTTELGRPQLPVLRRLVEVPAGMTLTASLAPAGRRSLPLSELGAREALLPVQRPVEKLPGAAALVPFEQDEELYARDALYPAQDVWVSGPFELRGHRLFMVEYAPLRYNPARAELEASAGGLLELRFAGEPDQAGAFAAALRSSPAHDAWLRQNVLNPALPAVPKGVSTDKYAEGILVVVGNAYAANANLAAYVEDRRAEGHKVEVVQMSAIGANDTALRAYVRAQYLAWSAPALSYVVLVGDVADVPAHNGSGGGNSQFTDLFYASIDPDNYAADLLAPDLFVSRISVNNAAELDLYLARAEKYIWADFPTDTTWLRKWSWLASCDNNDISEGTHNYVITNYTAPAGFTGTYPANPTAGGDKLYCGVSNPSEAVIATHLGNGRVVINMSGHGGEEYWADPSFTQDYLDDVLPADAIPFVVSNACITGSYGYGSDCWGEMWLAHQKGAILFFGSSNNSYWDEDDILEKALWDGVFQDGITRLADINQNSKLQTLAHYGPVDTMEYYFEMYNMLGDGTIDLYTDVPFVPAAMYPTEIPVGIDALDFSVTRGGAPVEGALVAVRGIGVQQVGLTDAAGQVQILMNPAPADVGNLEVTITGHNLQRHVGTIQVVPADGPYLVHAGHEVTSDGSTPVAPTPGRHVVLPISLRDIGNDPATGIQATLSTTSAAAVLTQAAPVFPDVAAGAVTRSTTHAELDTVAGAVDGALIDLKLDWSTAEGATGNTRFSVTVGRPHLVYVSHTVDDSQGLCDADGIPDVGEPTLFAVVVRNDGSADANGVEATLSAADVDGGDPVALGAVPSGAEATATFEVLPLAGLGCPALDQAFSLSVGALELPAPDVSGFTEMLQADIAMSTYTDDMEGAAPNGWTHAASENSDDWAYVTSSSHSPTHAWWCSDPGTNSDKHLDTPLISIGDTAVLSFWQRMSSESGYDGGTLEIGVNGTNFVDAGPYITQNGYNDSNWGGDEFWGGDIAWQQVLVDLSSFGPGSLKIRFHFTSDVSTGYSGWWIDDLMVDAETVVCQAQVCVIPNRAPDAVAGPDQDVAEGAAVVLLGSGSSDPDDDPISFAWAQTGGPAVALSDATAADPGFTAPDVDGQATLTFELTVSDGEYTDTDSVSVTVWDCADTDPCTDDVFSGAGCEHPAAADGTACDDGDPCTLEDACLAGACADSTPLACEPLDACHVAGTCDPATGECSHPPAADGTACDDADACTLADTCQAGACQAGTPVVCEALDACHAAGTCDPATGACSDPPVADGTTCDDGSLCTGSSSCQAGTCTGAEPVVCEPMDACHEAGVCDPASGDCTHPRLPDGTACGQGGTCQAGTCLGETPDDGEESGCGCSTDGKGSLGGLALLGLALALLRSRRRA
ncbi:MAG TPA: C25 family cysteine peptidase [Myxococcota bacterium]|nr:C25 family cysteine peptidase [Myxococcota bacterium]